MHPDHLLDQLTAVQLSEWEAYDRLDPIGTWRADYRMASIESTLINIHNASNTAEGAQIKVTDPSDFLPIWDEELRKKVAEKRKRKQSIDEMRSLLMAFASSQNATVDLREQMKNRPPTLKIKK